MTDATKRVGLGKVIYSVDEEPADEPSQDKDREEQSEVGEAIRESFPASDPPGFAGGTCADPEPSS